MEAGAFLAIWHDVEANYIDEYLRWHTFEHLPERLALPGFLRAHRLEREEGPGQDFLCIVDVIGMADFSGAEYLARLNAPTEWTRRLMPRYARVARALCRSVLDEGTGYAPLACCIRFNPLKHAADGASMSAIVEAIRLNCRELHFSWARLGAVDDAASGTPTEEKRLRRVEDTGGFDHVLFVGGVERTAFHAGVERLTHSVSSRAKDWDRSFYRHSFAAEACCAGR